MSSSLYGRVTQVSRSNYAKQFPVEVSAHLHQIKLKLEWTDIFFILILCDFAYLSNPDIHLLYIHVYCCRFNHTAAKNYLSLTHINIADDNEICICSLNLGITFQSDSGQFKVINISYKYLTNNIHKSANKN